jgi:hypothetical protein
MQQLRRANLLDGLDSPPRHKREQERAALENQAHSIQSALDATAQGASAPDGGARLRDRLAETVKALARLASPVLLGRRSDSGAGPSGPPSSGAEHVHSYPLAGSASLDACAGSGRGAGEVSSSTVASQHREQDVDTLADALGGLAVGGSSARTPAAQAPEHLTEAAAEPLTGEASSMIERLRRSSRGSPDAQAVAASAQRVPAADAPPPSTQPDPPAEHVTDNEAEMIERHKLRKRLKEMDVRLFSSSLLIIGIAVRAQCCMGCRFDSKHAHARLDALRRFGSKEHMACRWSGSAPLRHKRSSLQRSTKRYLHATMN